MKKRVLVVDDDAQVLKVCVHALERGGYTAFQAGDTGQARALLKEQAIDLVILDIHMPQEDGIRFLQRIRDSMPDLPVILITGYPAVSTVVNAMRLDAKEYLQKPFSVRDLLDAVERGLS